MNTKYINRLDEILFKNDVVTFPGIVCICGSSRFCGEIAVLKWEIEKRGLIAVGLHLLPPWYEGVQSDHQAEHEEVSSILDALHLQKIDLSSLVIVANIDGYIGERTKIEMDYAKKNGINVFLIEES